MAQFIEFVGNNLVLVGIWLALALALIFHRSKTSAQAVSTQQAVMLINRKDGVILDIRDKKDYDAGHIVDSIHIPLNKLGSQLAELEPFKARPIVVVCKMGQSSGDACKTLLNAGFSQAVRLRGGMAEWRGQNLPLIQKQAQKQKVVKEKPVKTKGRKTSKGGKTSKAALENQATAAVAAEPVTETMVPENVVTENVVPENVVPESVVAEDTVTENVVTEAVTGQVAAEDVITEDGVTEQAPVKDGDEAVKVETKPGDELRKSDN